MNNRTVTILSLLVGTFPGGLSAWNATPDLSTGKRNRELALPRSQTRVARTFRTVRVVADWPKPMSQLPGHDNWT